MADSEMPSISIVIPFLNEEASINRVLKQIFEPINWQALGSHFSSIEVIAVDDGSSDGGADRVRSFLGVQYISHEKTMGYGCSLRTGFSHARGDYIVFMDMDSSYLPNSIIDLFLELRRRDLDMCYGFRLRSGSQMPIIRKIGNHLFSFLVQRLFSDSVTDVCTGMRLFKRSLLGDILSIQEPGLSFSMSLTMVSLTRKWRIGQIAIPYLEREGRSKLSIVTDGFSFFWVILKAKFYHL